MHYLFALVLPVALAARTTQIRNLRNSQDWSVEPDKTADWYKDYGLAIPEPAFENLVVNESYGTSYIVKLECLGCPFRVREKYVMETWQEPPQANSLMLNFTISNSAPHILLNGDPIMPLESRPPAVWAFQIPANTTQDIMGKMVGMHMLDLETWGGLGTKYGHFELQYEHTLLATKEPGVELLQFDVTGIHMRGLNNPGSYLLNQEGQKMVQIPVSRILTKDKQVFVTKDAQVVDRKDKEQPFKMKCGKYAMVKTKYDPLEWDYYGQFGTWTRTWHKFFWGTGSFFDRNGEFVGLALALLALTSVVRRIWLSRQNAAATHLNEDAEAALLGVEHEDAPPAYADVSPLQEHKQDGQ